MGGAALVLGPWIPAFAGMTGVKAGVGGAEGGNGGGGGLNLPYQVHHAP